MKKGIFLCFFIFLFVISIQAQNVRPVFEVLEFDLVARTKPRLDLNEVPCAVLRISAADINEYVFDGNIVGDIIYGPGEALVYMANNSKKITIKSDKFGTLNYQFPECLIKQMVYKLSLSFDLMGDNTAQEKILNDLMQKSKRKIEERSSKTAKQETKRLKKEGWKTAPGAIPIEKQLDKSFAIQQQYNSDFEPMYLMGQAISVGRTYDAARLQAMELAKLELASMIEFTISTETENAITNKQLSMEEAVSIVSMLQKSKSKVMQRLGKVIMVMELYRDSEQGKEVLIRIAYDINKSKKEAVETIREELELSPEWGQKLGNILGAKEI